MYTVQVIEYVVHEVEFPVEQLFVSQRDQVLGTCGQSCDGGFVFGVEFQDRLVVFQRVVSRRAR